MGLWVSVLHCRSTVQSTQVLLMCVSASSFNTTSGHLSSEPTTLYLVHPLLFVGGLGDGVTHLQYFRQKPVWGAHRWVLGLIEGYGQDWLTPNCYQSWLMSSGTFSYISGNAKATARSFNSILTPLSMAHAEILVCLLILCGCCHRTSQLRHPCHVIWTRLR